MTLPQHLQALERANEVRYARAALKRALKARRLSVGDIIAPGAELPLGAHSMPVIDLLMSQPQWGRVKAARTLRGLGINERRSLGCLTERQREELVHATDLPKAIARGLAAGKTCEAIALALGCDRATVRYHRDKAQVAA